MKKRIFETATELVRRCGTRDPFKIAEGLGITVKISDGFTKLKGFYTVINRKRFIVLNSSLDENQSRIVLAHELGHDRFHRKLAQDACLREFVLYDMKSRPEYEANVFAAELLLDDSEVLALAKEGYDMEETAKILCTDINLAAIKIGCMNMRGFGFREQTMPRADFLSR